jgi:hypothetical protein
MININPQLPDPTKPDYAKNLNYVLTKLLREMAIEINRTSGSSWDGMHPILGVHHIWISSSGVLRIKNGAPTSDGDGQVIGTQT